MYDDDCAAGRWLQLDRSPSINSKVAILIFAVIGLWLSSIILTRTHNRIKDTALSRRLGCALPPELPKRWPLGIDRIKELWESNAEGRLLAFLCSVAEHYEPGNNLYQYLLFGPRAYHILHPSNVEALLSTNFKDFGFGCRPAVFAPLLGNGIFTQEGAAWKHSRDLLRKQFVRTQYQNLDTSLSEHVDNLIVSIPDRGVVDLQPLFFKLTMDAATSLLFGRSIYSLRAGVDQAAEDEQFAESFDIAQEGLAKRFRIAPFHFLYNPPKFRQACKNVHRYIEQYIDQVKCAQKNRPGEESSNTWFIDQLAAGSLSKADLRDQLLNVLLAGRDTTACCLSWTFRLLVRHESSLHRLRNEIASVLGDSSSPTREQIQQMPYLSCVVKESLRLYPPVPLNNREAIRTTILPTGGGPNGDRPIMVRKGELVVFSQYVNSRKKNIYGGDADQFRPERWETGELSGVGWAYFPFNDGPRQCLGRDFALMEVCYTVVRLLQAYPSIKLPLDEPNEPVGTEKQTLTLVLSSRDGCKVGVTSSL